MKSIKKFVSDTKSSLSLDSQKINSQRYNLIDMNTEINADQTNFSLNSASTNKCFLIVSCNDLKTIKETLEKEFNTVHEKYKPQIEKLNSEKEDFDGNFTILKKAIEEAINLNTGKIDKGEFKEEIEQFKKKMLVTGIKETKIGSVNITREGRTSDIDELKNTVEKKYKAKLDEIKKSKKQELSKDIVMTTPLKEVKLKSSKAEFSATITKINPGSNKIYGEFIDAKNTKKTFDVSFDTLCSGYDGNVDCKQSGGYAKKMGGGNLRRDEISTDELC